MLQAFTYSYFFFSSIARLSDTIFLFIDIFSRFFEITQLSHAGPTTPIFFHQAAPSSSIYLTQKNRNQIITLKFWNKMRNLIRASGLLSNDVKISRQPYKKLEKYLPSFGSYPYTVIFVLGVQIFLCAGPVFQIVSQIAICTVRKISDTSIQGIMVFRFVFEILQFSSSV